MIWTIGYSNRSLPEFLHELQSRGITQLVDVRSSPWSRYPVFNANQIASWADREGILYRQEGAVLGGRAEIGLDHPDYIAALDRIIDAARREPLALMCAEGDPAQCHRTWDIGASLLARYGLIVRNILRDGREEDATETLRRVSASRIAAEIYDMLLARLGPLSDI